MGSSPITRSINKDRLLWSVLIYVVHKGNGTRRERPARRRVKNHLVNGCLVPRAGPGTAPVPGEVPLPAPTESLPLGRFFVGVFAIRGLEGRIRKGAGDAFSRPGIWCPGATCAARSASRACRWPKSSPITLLQFASYRNHPSGGFLLEFCIKGTPRADIFVPSSIL